MWSSRSGADGKSNNKKGLRNMKQSRSIVSDIAFLLALVLTLTIVGIRVVSAAKGEPALYFGKGVTITMSQSMEPVIMTGAATVFEPQTEYNIGDIVVFKNRDFGKGDAYICHRIINIEDGLITTKGDNNRTLDQYQTPIENIDGKVVGIHNWTASAGKVVLLAGATMVGVSFASRQLKKNKEDGQ